MVGRAAANDAAADNDYLCPVLHNFLLALSHISRIKFCQSNK
jgi:hypothetical protein